MPQQHAIGSRDEWRTARLDLLEREKKLTRLRDELAAERRRLPWVRLDKHYEFDGPAGRVPMRDLSVYARSDQSEIFHTYSTYSRGLDPINRAYQLLDLTPKGRDEDDLPWPMAWVRRHDSY
jgi:predicted dithiol-disulfide oxidoreductase (DUF899 family)